MIANKVDVAPQPPFKVSPYSPYYSLKSSETFTILPSELKAAPTNWLIEVPIGYQLKIYSSDYLAQFGIVVINSPASYGANMRKELMVYLLNLGGTCHQVIKNQDEIARIQLERIQPFTISVVEANEITYPKDR